jgi:hypothetical protein
MHKAVATPMPINVLKLGEGFLLTRSPILASPPPIRQDNTLVRPHLGPYWTVVLRKTDRLCSPG